MDNTLLTKDENGNITLDDSFIQAISEKITSEYMNQLSEDDLNKIYKAIDEEIFDDLYNSNTKTFRKKVPDRPYSRYSDTPLWKECKDRYACKFSTLIDNKVEEILSSEEYIKKLDSVCREIMDYAVEGYKQDMIQRLRERLIGNVISAEPYVGYDNRNLRMLIHEEIQAMMPDNNGYGGY